jgi:hypothetical protein
MRAGTCLCRRRGEDNEQEKGVEKCVTCQYYDRRNATPSEGKGPMWGQCRRAAPRLHPLNAKSYMIEGVWPHVRDDDWCGDWKIIARRVEARSAQPASLITTPAAAGVTRITPLPGPTAASPSSVGAPLPSQRSSASD